MGMGHGYGSWVWVMGMGHGYGSWVWVMGMGMGMGHKKFHNLSVFVCVLPCHVEQNETSILFELTVLGGDGTAVISCDTKLTGDVLTHEYVYN